jgi:hypothetical protein
MPFLWSQGLPRYDLSQPFKDFWDTLFMTAQFMKHLK